MLGERISPGKLDVRGGTGATTQAYVAESKNRGWLSCRRSSSSALERLVLG